MSAMHVCKNCANNFTGKFCNNCGEKVYTDKDKQVKYLFSEAFHFVTHFDGTFFRSLKSIFFKPGKMSLEYCNGARKKYFKPVSLFLISIIIYLLFPVFEGLNMRFDIYNSTDYNYASYAIPITENKMQTKNISYKEIKEKYDSRSGKYAKPMLLLLLPLSALFMWVLHFRSRRLFFDHFILATEITSFFIIFNYIIMPLLMIVGMFLYQPFGRIFKDEGFAWQFSTLLFILVSYFAMKRFYGQVWWLALLKAFLFVFCFTFIIQLIYKLILYLTIMLFI